MNARKICNDCAFSDGKLGWQMSDKKGKLIEVKTWCNWKPSANEFSKGYVDKLSICDNYKPKIDTS